MELEWDEHFAEIVLPAWQDYLQAERVCCRSLKVDQRCLFSTDQVASAGTQDLVPIC
jgi:hypothetical protein